MTACVSTAISVKIFLPRAVAVSYTLRIKKLHHIEFIWLIINTLILKGTCPQKYVKCLKWCKNSDFRAFSKRPQDYVVIVIPTKNGLLLTHIPLRNTPPYFQDCSCSGYVGPALFLNPVRHFSQCVMYCGIHLLPRLWEFTLN